MRRVDDDAQQVLETMIDERTKLEIGNPARLPFDEECLDYQELVANVLKRQRYGVASFSGIRQIFDATFGDEETDYVDGDGTHLTDAARVFVATIADCFAELVKGQPGCEDAPTVFVGLDTRPTGPAIADVMIRTLLSHGVQVCYVFVAAITEIAVCTRALGDAFVFISASHNPRGYNGLKLGLADGRILPAAAAHDLIDRYEARLPLVENAKAIVKKVNAVSPELVRQVYEAIPTHKARSLAAYEAYCNSLVTGQSGADQAQTERERIRQEIEAKGLWIGVDPNGGARDDKAFLEALGYHVAEINARPRYDMAHDLAPNPEATAQAQEAMKKLRQEGKNVIAFFVFDADGDRRNIVLPADTPKAALPGVQKVFALDVLARLTKQVADGKLHLDPLTGKPKETVAVVVNGASSSLWEQLADRIGFVLKRTETGEAAVTQGGVVLAEQGTEVVMLGEGSNGCAFTLDAPIREPMHTIASVTNFVRSADLTRLLLKLLGQEERYEDWHSARNLARVLPNIIASLPPSVTTDTFSDEARYAGLPLPSDRFKRHFDDVFEEEFWPQVCASLQDAYCRPGEELSHEFVHYEVSDELRGRGNRRNQEGGYKIEIFHESPEARRLIGWLWFRRSLTERGLTRRAASLSHWSHAAAPWLSEKQRSLYDLLTEALVRAERRACDEVFSTEPHTAELRAELTQALRRSEDPRYEALRTRWLSEQS